MKSKRITVSGVTMRLIKPDYTDLSQELRKAQVVPDGPGRTYQEVTWNGFRLRRTKIFCVMCKEAFPNAFMVHDYLWAKVCPGNFNPNGEARGGVLCFDCTEIRLGRKLTRDDLQPEPRCNRELLRFMPRDTEYRAYIREGLTDQWRKVRQVMDACPDIEDYQRGARVLAAMAKDAPDVSRSRQGRFFMYRKEAADDSEDSR